MTLARFSVDILACPLSLNFDRPQCKTPTPKMNVLGTQEYLEFVGN